MDAPQASAEIDEASAGKTKQRRAFLVFGLGNPGIEYQWTPHNAGFLAVDRIADQLHIAVENRRCKSITATTTVGGEVVVLAKPETFMNLSGAAVRALAREFDADLTRDVVVIYDELALPFGTMRVRGGGSSGGHNGAKSINASIGRQDWPRIRIGVGPDPEGGREEARRRGKDYLLTPMKKQDLLILDKTLDRVAEAVEVIRTEGVLAAMNRFNGKPLKADG